MVSNATTQWILHVLAMHALVFFGFFKTKGMLDKFIGDSKLSLSELVVAYLCVTLQWTGKLSSV